MKHKIKKLINVTLACFMALSIVQINWTTKAASPDVSIETKSSWTNHGDAWGAGSILRVDGDIAFCLQGDKGVHEGANDKIDPADIGLSDVQVNELALIAWYGYRSQPSVTHYFLTQNLIWKYLKYNSYATSAEYPSLSSQQDFFDSVMDKVNHFHDKPSFNLKTYTANVNETLEIKDTKDVLNGLTIESVTGATVKKGGSDKNTLLVTPTANAADTITIKFNRGMSLAQTKTNFVVRSGDSQAVSTCTGQDPYYASVRVNVNKYGNLEIAKKNEDGDYVPNTKFKLSYNSDMSSPIGTYTTGSNGKVLVEELQPKKVYIQEVSVPAPYVVDSTIRSITVLPNDTVSYTATNQFKKGNLEIKKLDKQSGKVVKKAGVEFDIFKNDDTLVSTIATNSNGVASLKNLRYGNYYALEKTAPDKYFISDERINFSITENDVTIEKSLSNNQIKGRIDLTKEDCEVGKRPQGDGTLQGAVYTLYAKDDILDPADNSTIYEAGTEIMTATIKDYKASFNDLYLGKYKVVETTPPKTGYLLDDKEYEVNLTSASYVKTVSSCDLVKKQAFKVAKFVDNDGSSGVKPALKGAEFTFILERYVEEYGWDNALSIAKDKDDERILDSEWGYFVTDDEGVGISKKLPFGKYIVKETIVPENHYASPDFTVTIENDSDTPLNFVYVNDPAFTTILAIVKKDAQTQNTIELAGATFKIKCLEDNSEYKEGEYVGWWLWNPLPHYVDSFTTTDNGTVMLPKEIPAGLYALEEIKAPNGYLLAKTSKPFRIAMNSIHQQVGPDNDTIITTVTFDDTAVKGQVKVQKEAELFKGYTSIETEYGELFKPVYEKGLLPGVKFEIKAKTDIIGADGKTWYHAGQRVEVLTTDGETITTSSQLPLGTEGNNIYSIKEIETAEGYVLDDTIRYFRFDYVDENTAIVNPTWLDENGNELNTDEIITLDNQHETSLILTTKVMEISDLKDKAEAYKNVIFGIFANQVEQLEKDSLVGIIDVKENGIASTTLSQAGSYYLKELSTDSDYETSTEVYPFTFTYHGDKLQQITVNNGKPIYNYLKRGTIEVYKQDSDSKLPLMNVCFELATDKDFSNIIKTTWTDENGKAIFEELEANYTYFIREKYDGKHDMVDKGYIYDPTIHEVTLDDEIVKLHLTNTQVKGKVQFTKTGESFNKVEIVNGKFGKEHHPVWSQGSLLGATLTIKAAEDITTWDKTTHYQKGDIVTELSSDWNTVDSLLLPVGKYIAYESRVPIGYIKDDTIYEFEITPNGKADIQLNAITINNTRAKANINLTKTMEKQSTFINKKAYKDVVFGLYARDDIYDYMGNVAIEHDSLIGVSNINESGHLTNTFDLPNGTYYYKELQTNSQYQLDTNEYDFEVSYQGEAVKDYTIDINNGQPINNDLKRAAIEIIKTTKDSLYYSETEQRYADSFHTMDKYAKIYKNPLIKDKFNYLTGVTFEIATDKAFTNIIDTKKTDGDGRIVFDELELGTYYIREKATLTHYILTDEIFQIELTKHGQFETINVDNKLITTDIMIHKVDEADHTISLKGAEFTMYEDKACTKQLAKAITNKLGNAIFKDIEFGSTVYIKETKAPAGYELSDEIIEVTINDEWLSKDIQQRMIEYTNQKSPTPNTGDSTNFLMIICLLIVSGSVILLSTKRKS